MGLALGNQLVKIARSLGHPAFPLGGVRPTDHDPQLALLMLGAAPVALTLINGSVDENRAAGTEAALEKVRASIDGGAPVLAFNLFGDAVAAEAAR